MTKAIKLSVIYSLGFLLTACGGGGDSASVSNVDPQGFWTGPSPAGYTVNAVVLDTGETWGVYSSGSIIYGGLYGTVTTNGSTATATGTDFNFITNSLTSSSFTGPVVAKSTMTLSNANGALVPLTYQASYDTPATAAAAAGTWSFVGRSGLYQLIPGNVTISSSGSFTLIQPSCTTTGSIVPRAGGKNIYNVTLTAVGIGCAAGQSTLAGVGYVDTTVNPNRFIGLALTPSKNDGLIVIGTKQ